jgi:hypothetical protein
LEEHKRKIFLEEVAMETRRLQKRPGRRAHRAAHNGGMPIESPFQTRIISEQELVPLLDQGWEVIRELASGKIIVRRPNGLDE